MADDSSNSHTYTSDTDSQWEPVSISYSSPSALPPSAEDFRRAISTSATVEELQISDFDPQTQYGAVIDAVKEAAAGAENAQIFRVPVDRTRVEYYIVAVAHAPEAAEKKLVGVVARAVES
ncbi:hypothetical protein DV737_g5193, partial [Chaetothyriales sp. CBS 132003]